MDVGESDAVVMAYDETYGITYPTISGNEGGGNEVHIAYGVTGSPTLILIAPDHAIVEQFIFPFPNAQAIINPLQSYGIEANECNSSPLSADFEADNTVLCLQDETSFTDNSVGDVTSWEWTFEGGDPATSDEQNPVVTYNTAGVYNVTLSVSDGTETAEVSMDDYITVNEITALFEADETDICDLEQVQYSSQSLCADTYEWTFEGGDPATSNEQNPVVTYNVAGTYSVSLTVSNDNGESTVSEDSYVLVHNCTDIAEYTKLEMSIVPNPSTGVFQLEFSNQDYYQVFVYDMTGHLLYSTTLSNTNNQLDISHLENGIYIVNASNGSAQVKQRIILAK